MRKAIFLDKDGTLIVDVPYNADPAKIVLERGVGTALKRLSAAGYMLIVISNQAGIAHGFFTEDAIQGVQDKLYELLLMEGVKLDGFYYCPHHPAGKIKAYSKICECRKPGPGMLFKAARQLRIKLSQSWMVGDILHDIEAGNRAGCQTILIDNGNETEWDMRLDRIPGFIADDMEAAAAHILSTGNNLAYEQQRISDHR
ncbi:HAD family hydrolase [Chitinophaga horti]|uniref:D,D-heptose 1,7-bisphosphate phosphatase n=1 Tax=Chitinophaga horti TaxID=2920382 RepID=A0ABY6J3D6_9BACT|nr:HAD family hydrolase [Chitinophaga horti]UYQ94093.1 HAD family hydrolase [Chitinophaga horti]